MTVNAPPTPAAKVAAPVNPPHIDHCAEVTGQYTRAVILALAAVSLNVSPQFFGPDWAGAFTFTVARLTHLTGATTSLASVLILVVSVYYIARGDRRREVAEWMQRYELATVARRTILPEPGAVITSEQAHRERRRAELVGEIADFEQTSKGYAVFARVVFLVTLLAVVLVDRLL